MQAKLSLLLASAIQSSWLGGVLSIEAPDTSPPSVAEVADTPPDLEDTPQPIVPRGANILLPPPPDSPLLALWPDGPPPPELRLPILEEAADRVAAARAMTASEFYSLGARSRAAAFTVTAAISVRAIDKIRDILSRNMEVGADREAFMEEVADAFGGEAPITEAHLEQVFRNNVLAAWSDGADDSLQHSLVVDEFPYRQYYATTDERVRDDHMALESLGLNNTNVYRADDPVWQLFRPPWAWNCRCSWAPLSVAMAAKLNVEEAVDWLGRATLLQEQGGVSAQQAIVRTAPAIPQFVDMPPFEPPEGWNRSLVS